MKRRTAIRNVVLISAGTAMLYACQDKAAIVTKNIPITGAEEDLLDHLTEAILPKTDFPGANDFKTTEFIFTMADDCLSPDDQAKFMKGMKAFDDFSTQEMGKRFVKLSKEEKDEFLGIVESGKPTSDDLKWFYKGVKQSTIRNFTTSQQYLAEVRNVTTLIPVKFQACVPVATV